MKKSRVGTERKIIGTLIYFGIAFLSLTVGLIICGIILQRQGYNPIDAYYALLRGAFLGKANLSASFVRAIPLIFMGLGVTVAFKSGIFNIGGDGQMYLGAMAATWVGTQFNLPFIIHLPLAILAGMLAGALWALMPVYLKVKKNFNEVITTILLNYIGIYLVGIAVRTFLKDPLTNVPQSPSIKATALLPKLLAGSELHSGIILAVLAVIAVSLILSKTDWGFALQVCGENPEAAVASGIPKNKVLITAMLISGAFAGLAGAGEILGYQKVLLDGFAVNTGYDAIAVALLARLNPIGVLFSAFFFGSLKNGANMMQIIEGVPTTIIYIIQAVIILCVIAGMNIKVIADYIGGSKEGEKR